MVPVELGTRGRKARRKCSDEGDAAASRPEPARRRFCVFHVPLAPTYPSPPPSATHDCMAVADHPGPCQIAAIDVRLCSSPSPAPPIAVPQRPLPLSRRHPPTHPITHPPPPCTRGVGVNPCTPPYQPLYPSLPFDNLFTQLQALAHASPTPRHSAQYLGRAVAWSEHWVYMLIHGTALPIACFSSRWILASTMPSDR